MPRSSWEKYYSNATVNTFCRKCNSSLITFPLNIMWKCGSRCWNIFNNAVQYLEIVPSENIKIWWRWQHFIKFRERWSWCTTEKSFSDLDHNVFINIFPKLQSFPCLNLTAHGTKDVNHCLCCQVLACCTSTIQPDFFPPTSVWYINIALQ